MSHHISTPFKSTPITAGCQSPEKQNAEKRKIDVDFAQINLFRCKRMRRDNPIDLPTNVSYKKYFERYTKVVDSIRYSCKRKFIVWCPTASVKADYIISLVAEFGRILYKTDRWIMSSANEKLMEWGGMLVAYDSHSDAVRAAEKLPFKYGFLKTILLRKLILDLGSLEASHRKFGKMVSGICIRCSDVIDDYMKKYFREMLQDFGDLLSVEYEENMCTVTYRYMTHAYLAGVILNGKLCEPIGKLYVTVTKSEMQSEIIMDLKENIMVHIDSICPSS